MERLDPRTARAMLTGPTARKGTVAVVDQGLLSATSFLAGVMLARLCSKEEFGAYALAFAVMLAANSLQGALISGPLTVLGASREGDDWRGYATSVAMAQVVLGLAAALLAAGVSTGLAVAGIVGKPLGAALMAMSAALFFVQGQEFCRRVLYTRLRAWRVLLNDAAYCALQVGGLLALWRLGGGHWGLGGAEATPGLLDGWSVFLCMGASAAAGTLLGLWQIRGDLAGGLTRLREDLSETWSFGKWSLSSAGLAYVKDNTSPYVLAAVLSLAELAAMRAVLTVLRPLQLAYVPIMTVLTPRLAREYATKGWPACRHLAWRFTLVLSVVLVIPALGVTYLSLELMDVLFGSKYNDYALLLAVWAPFYPLLGIWNAIFGSLSGVVRRPQIGFRALAITAPLVIVASVVLVPVLGIWGAFCVNSAASLATTCVAYASVRKALHGANVIHA